MEAINVALGIIFFPFLFVCLVFYFAPFYMNLVKFLAEKGEEHSRKLFSKLK